MSDAVIKTTRTEVRTEEVTETRYRCHVCDMVYDDDEVLTIGLDRAEMPDTPLFGSGVEPRAERIVCRHCSDGLFGYEPDDDSTLGEPSMRFDLDWATMTGATGAVVLLVGLPLAVVSGLVAAATGTGLFVPAAVAVFVGGVGLGRVVR